jgi:hypothetical protein
MRLKSMLIAAGVALAAGLSLSGVAAEAQDRALERDREMHRLHEACDHGDRGACVRFGIILGENRERHEEWRRTHPEYWWWER